LLHEGFSTECSVEILTNGFRFLQNSGGGDGPSLHSCVEGVIETWDPGLGVRVLRGLGPPGMDGIDRFTEAGTNGIPDGGGVNFALSNSAEDRIGPNVRE